MHAVLDGSPDARSLLKKKQMISRVHTADLINAVFHEQKHGLRFFQSGERKRIKLLTLFPISGQFRTGLS